jgi:hypothetical protein
MVMRLSDVPFYRLLDAQIFNKIPDGFKHNSTLQVGWTYPATL